MAESTLPQTALQKIGTLRDYLTRPDALNRFAMVMGGREARYYVSSVLMAVAFKPELADCTYESIMKSALRAASLELSCDESMHQAQLVPYNNRKTGRKEAQLIVHYLGIVNLAQRTGKYRTINWGPVYEGMAVELDILTGLHTIGGQKSGKDAKVLGYFAFFEMLNGFKKSEYMTIQEIHEHAAKFSPSYHSDYSKWKDPKILPYLEQKTVIRKLMKIADLSGKAGAVLAQALSEDELPAEELVEAASVVDIPPESGLAEPQYVPVDRSEEIDLPPEQEIERPMAAEPLRAWLDSKVKRAGIHVASDKQRGLLVALMEEAFAPDPDAQKIRRSCMVYLWNVASSKMLTGPQIKVALDWLNPKQDSGGQYLADATALAELKAVWTAALAAKGQTELPGMNTGGTK